MLKFTDIERSLRQNRSKVMPASATTVAAILAAFAKPTIMRSFGRSLHDNPELFFNTAFANDDFSYCIMSSATIVQLILGQNDISNYRIDVTFPLVPCGCFKYLLIIYVEYDKKV